MKEIQLELEELLTYFREMEQISLEEASNAKILWEEGYATGQHGAYDDAIDRCERLMESITGVHPEPRPEYI